MKSRKHNVAEFMKKHGLNVRKWPYPMVPLEERIARLRYIMEEVGELAEAMHKNDLEGIADALGDLDYVVHGAALTYGLDLDKIHEEIHRSNMTKEPLDKLGKGGKIPGKYEPPNLTRLITPFADREA